MKKLKYSRRGEYSVIYSNMKGVDFSGDGSSIDDSRFAYAENMYKDYTSGGNDVIESIPGYRKLLNTNGTVRNLFTYKGASGESQLVIHADSRLITLAIDNPDHGTIKVYQGLEDGKSDSFFADGKLFIIDGASFTTVSDSGIAKVKKYYIPTLTVNGERFEQGNLLTRSAKEKYLIGSASDMSYGTPGIKYLIIDEENKYCRVVGYEGTDSEIYIPKLVKIGNSEYTVREIGRAAFYQKGITALNISDGVIRIENLAFYGCSALKSVVLGEYVTEIGTSAFADCSALEILHLGLSLKEIGQNAFSFCTAINRVTYSGNENEYAEIINTSSIPVAAPVYGEKNLSAKLFIPVFSPFEALSNVSMDNQNISFSEVYNNGLVSGYSFSVIDKTSISGKTLIASGVLSSYSEDYIESHRGFLASAYKNDGYPARAILGCTVAASFDGRIFLTGNREYPGYVFYSEANINGENDPLYFGEFNYFRDGDGEVANVAMLPLSDSLAVFKEKQDGNGSIFYHSAQRTDTDFLTAVYPLAYTHSGIVALGNAFSFNDDALFVSERGVLALEKSSVSDKRRVASRSHNVNARLLSENLADASLCEWNGYLAVGINGRIYLADSRSLFRHESGDYEYEWYFLSGIGSYKNDEQVYRYSSCAREGFFTKDDPDTEVKCQVMSARIESEPVYYTEEDGVRYEVYPTEQRRGGEFYPLTKIISSGDLLIFASADGSISAFNTDKRGVAPDFLKNSEGFSEEDYRLAWGNRLHPHFYSFAGHAPRYAVSTKRDNCNLPHLIKNTVKNSAAIKYKSLGAGALTVEAGTDGKGYSEIIKFPGSSLIFSNLDFANLTLTTEDSFTVPTGDRSKKWVEKQITIFTNDFESPFGIYTIAYRFEVFGYIKK